MGNNAFLTDMGTRIAQRRKELHITQEQLADKMGVSLQTVSCIELGKKSGAPGEFGEFMQSFGYNRRLCFVRKTEQAANERYCGQAGQSGCGGFPHGPKPDRFTL